MDLFSRGQGLLEIFFLLRKEKPLCFRSKAFTSLQKKRQKHYVPHLEHTRLHCPNHIVHWRRHDQPLRIEVAILRSQKTYRRDQYIGTGQCWLKGGGGGGAVWPKANSHYFFHTNHRIPIFADEFLNFYFTWINFHE